MNKISNWMLVMLVLAGLLSACAPQLAGAEKVAPSKTEDVEGSDFKLLTLTEKAVSRLDVQTAPVVMEQVNGRQHKVIPYAAVLYGLNGETWAYTNPEPLVYFREVIVIDHIDGDKAVLSEGPDVDMPVVTVGVSLLYGAEVGVSK
jgi:hypothetical protein